MSKRIGLLIFLVMALLLPGNALAQDPIQVQHTDPFWQATYWNNTTLSGNPVLRRTEVNLDFNWGTGSPDPGVNADGFSARWTRYMDVTPGTYRFTATSDDGIRIWVDGNLLINEWYDHAVKTVYADIYLSAGHHLVTVEYYENKGLAVARVSWAPAPPQIINWKGEYFNNPSLSGSPALVRDDGSINFNWGTGSPAPGVIGADRFSVRWTRMLNFSAGSYRFTVTADDGVRLWVNNHLLIDAWREQAPTTYTGDIYLPGGSVPLKMEYYENGGLAVAQLSWAVRGAPSPPPATGAVVVDDTDAGFVRGGAVRSWRTESEGYNGRLTWTKNNDRARANYNWARWYPSLAPGRYEVFVFIPERFTTTAAARYWVAHADGYTLRIVNQSANGNRWVSLGTYRFRGTRDDYVSLSDITYEPYISRLIAFDAVKWERR